MIIGKALIIKYEKIEELPKIKAGYIDIETTAKRYEDSIKSFSVDRIFDDLSVKDNFYFIENECSDYFKNLNSKFKLLDVGCGSGLYSSVFHRNGSPFENTQYIGTEIDEKFVRTSKKYFPKDDFLVSYADKIALKDNTIDFIFCSSTLHYTLNDWKKSLKEFSRVSRKYVAVTRFPVTKYNDTFCVHQTVRGRSGTENHYFIVINREELEKYFEKIGLHVLKRDYSSQEYNIKGINEKIVLVQYLLGKK